MIVEVTAEDIEKGVACETDRCPIALAILRKPGVRDVMVNNEEIIVDRVSSRAYYIFPRRVSDFVDQFDYGQGPGPIKFDAKQVRRHRQWMVFI
ncbi:hypothetical protein BJD55_gp039 [Gordonia phage Yvonnetastic]|uniref:Uncharacterized protein n=1 Tax=Gordonia phage Yvonnetastic TaxID=1821566 RepID=A0A142K9E4_9CAUD|nr:hypothetical protein BJD55_gp039 [Gordonia phage Yvonnetastic]AMS02727.1 hypothetical protein SEA_YVONNETASTIC_183 [Gordonia phage Yvonnetastic]